MGIYLYISLTKTLDSSKMKGSKGKKQSSNKGLAAAELALLKLPTTGKFILNVKSYQIFWDKFEL